MLVQCDSLTEDSVVLSHSVLIQNYIKYKVESLSFIIIYVVIVYLYYIKLLSVNDILTE